MKSVGFTPSELRTLRALKTPAGIQRYLDKLPYNLSFTARSPQRVFCRGRAPRHRISTIDFRFGSRAGYGPCRRNLQDWETLGRGREIEFYRLPLSRTGLSQPARTGHELFQYLFQSARRTYAAAVFTPGESWPVRSSQLDDNGKTDLVYCRTSLRNPTHPAAHATDGKAAHACRSAHIPGRNDRPQKKQNLIVKARTIISILGDAKNVARAIFQVN